MEDTKKIYRQGYFEKGGKPGPGAPKMDPELRASYNYTKTELKVALTRYATMPFEEVLELAKNRTNKDHPSSKLPAIEHVIIAVLTQSIAKGDQVRMDALLDRLLGKVAQKVENVGERMRDVNDLDAKHRELAILISDNPTGLIENK